MTKHPPTNDPEGTELSPFARFIDAAWNGELEVSYLREMNGLSASELRELCELLDGDLALKLPPYKLVLKARGKGRPPIDQGQRLIDSLALFSAVQRIRQGGASLEAAIAQIAKERAISEGTARRMYSIGRDRSLFKKSPT